MDDVFLDHYSIVSNSIRDESSLGGFNDIFKKRFNLIHNDLCEQFVHGVTLTNVFEILEHCGIWTFGDQAQVCFVHFWGHCRCGEDLSTKANDLAR